MSCRIGLNNAIDKILDNKPWFKFHREIYNHIYNETIGSIHLIDSPKNKINYKSSVKVAQVVAKTINNTVNLHYPGIGQIASPGLDTTGRGIIIIAPTDAQLDYLNAEDEKRRNTIRDRIRAERQRKEEELYFIQRDIESNVEITPEGDITPRTSSEVELESAQEEYEIDFPIINKYSSSTESTPLKDEIDLEIEESEANTFKAAKDNGFITEDIVEKTKITSETASIPVVEEGEQLQIPFREANLRPFSEIREDMRVKEGKIITQNNKIVGFDLLDQDDIFSEEVSREKAIKLFNKKNKKKEDYNKLALYYITVFLNQVSNADSSLFLAYDRFKRIENTQPKILIVEDNKRQNPFFQYNNVVVIGLKQLSDLIKTTNTASFERFEELIKSVSQEEFIHLFADYLLYPGDIEDIYNEMTPKDIAQIEKVYGRKNMPKENVVHEYVRMVVQQRIFGKTTEYETFTLTDSFMKFFENLLKELSDLLSSIVGATNTSKAIENVIAFTKGDFSRELDDKIKNRIFKQGTILEAELKNLISKRSALSTSGLFEQWQSNEQSLLRKYPEITYQDFVSLTEQERENLLICL